MAVYITFSLYFFQLRINNWCFAFVGFDLRLASSLGFAVKKHVGAPKWRDEIRRAQFRPDETRWLFYTLRRYDRSSDVAAASGRRRVWTFQAYKWPRAFSYPLPLPPISLIPKLI